LKKSLITLVVMLTAAALVAVFCGPAAAKVSGVCGDCHTMHNSQDGADTATEGPYTALLMDDCVGCHSSSDSSPTKTIGVSTVPVVYNLSKPNYNPGTLAGGNFWWVADSGGNDDAKGHNVLGISGVDSLSFAPGGFSECSGMNCHISLAKEQTTDLPFGSGCQGCHLRPAHHADDSATVIGAESPSIDGYYRFLSGHWTGDDYGVCGIEDSDWQADYSAGDHNEYLGFSGEDKEKPSLGSVYAAFSNLDNTMTAFCCGCHGKFHQEKNTSGEWIRHPSDAVIPDTGEYQYAFGSTGSGAPGIYDPLVPVARAALTSVTDTVAIGGTSPDMVMCLSCHRPHGSPYNDLLRWDYGDMLANGGDSTTGCFACHTKKDTESNIQVR
jgi:predicted CXXCH cytochrome family protein